MKSQAKQLLEKMSSNTQIIVKHCSKPSRHFKKMIITYHWSLAINKLQKIIMSRCQEPLNVLKKDIKNMKQSKSAQPSLIIINSLNKHVRYLSQQEEVKTKTNSQNSSICEEMDEPESTQRNSNVQKKILKIDFQKMELQSSDVKSSAHFQSQSGLDQLKFNEEFLDLFKKQKESSQFGQLCPDKIKEQEILIKKIIDSRPSKPNTDIKTFLSLIKKPQIEIEEVKTQQQQHQTMYIIIILIFFGMMILYLVI